MRTKATVVAIEGNIAIALCDRTSACDGCHKHQAGEDCSVCSLMGAGRQMKTRARNDAGAAVGDVVWLESDTGRVLLYAVLVFLMPLVAVILGYWISGIWLDALSGWRYLCAFGAFVLCFVGLRLFSEHGRETRTDVRVSEIVSRRAEENAATKTEE